MICIFWEIYGALWAPMGLFGIVWGRMCLGPPVDAGPMGLGVLPGPQKALFHKRLIFETKKCVAVTKKYLLRV